MTERIIKDQEITETQVVPDLLTGSDIGTWQAEYLLREVEFERIKHGKPVTYNWANSLALTTFGFGLSLLAKGYSDALLITKGEWIALAVGVAASGVLYVIGIYIPDNRKRVMKKIESHFETAPTQRQILRGRE
jgi:hypothetical protein